MAEDWDAVAKAIDSRLRELPLTVRELARRARLGESTVRELRYNSPERVRHPGTLRSVSTGLEWPENHLSQILAGEVVLEESVRDVGRATVESLHRRLDEIEAMLRRLLDHVGAEPAESRGDRDDDQ